MAFKHAAHFLAKEYQGIWAFDMQELDTEGGPSGKGSPDLFAPGCDKDQQIHLKKAAM